MQMVNKRKTEAILKFIAMMKEYLICTEIKEEHLGDLRKQFAVDSKAIKDLIRQLI